MIEKINEWFKHKTVKIRHSVVKIIAPKLFQFEKEQRDRITETPRPATKFIKFHFKSKQLIGAEIGVASGENAYSILTMLAIKKLYLIDPYIPYYQDKKLFDFSSDKNVAKERLKEFEDKICWIYEPSEIAINKISKPLDFVYIDGNHEYEYVKKDILYYSSIVRKGGVISGHDIHMYSVRKAVFEVFKPEDILIFFPDWIVIKLTK